MRRLTLVAAVLTAFSAAGPLVHNKEYIPEPYDAYAEIIVEATVEVAGDSFTGPLALYDRAIIIRDGSYSNVAYVPIRAGTVVEKIGRNNTRIMTPDGKVYEGKASTRNGGIVLVCKKLGPVYDTRMIMNLQAKYNYLSGVDHVGRLEVHRVLEDRYIEDFAPHLGVDGSADDQDRETARPSVDE